jgi:hypothetical protein
MTEQKYPRAFISYNHNDKETALKIADGLASKGVDPWADFSEIGPGDSIFDKIFEEGLKTSQVFVILLSPDSVESRWVRHELNVALLKRIQQTMKVIPVVVRECTIPQALQTLRWLDLNDGLDKVVDEIVDAAYEKKPDRPPVQPPPLRVLSAMPPKHGLSQTATTVAWFIARNADLSKYLHPEFRGEAIQQGVGLSPEQINDAAEELESKALVKVHRFLGTAPFRFGFLVPTFRLFYTFPESLGEGVNPAEDVRKVASAVVSLKQADGDTLVRTLSLPPFRVNLAVESLAKSGLVEAVYAFGTAPFTFAYVVATGATRRFVSTG